MKIRYFLLSLSIVVGISCKKVATDPFDGRLIDLSHSYDQQTPFWPTADDFSLDTVAFGMTEGDYFYSAFTFSTAEHGGTHIDAPIHFAEGKRSVDEIPLEQLIGSAITIDVEDSCQADIDYLVTVDDLRVWESKNGIIPKGSIVLIRTGFGKFWPDKLKYMGTDRKGIAAVLLLHFPGLSADAARWLADERAISAIGIDTPSIDFGRSSDFLTHRVLMEQNIPAFENLANLDLLPSKDFQIIALPMKIRGGSGGPLRIVAHIPN